MELKAKAEILSVVSFFCMILGCAVPNKAYATAKRYSNSRLTPQARRTMLRRVGTVPTERASILEMRILLERMGGGRPQQTGSVLDSARVRRVGYSEFVGFVPMRERILNCLNEIASA